MTELRSPFHHFVFGAGIWRRLAGRLFRNSSFGLSRMAIRLPKFLVTVFAAPFLGGTTV